MGQLSGLLALFRSQGQVGMWGSQLTATVVIGSVLRLWIITNSWMSLLLISNG